MTLTTRKRVGPIASALAGALLLANAAVAQRASGPDPGRTWNEMSGEKLAALRLPGDAVRGKEAYAVCAACHLANGAGRPDGTFPQLAGQHSTVLIKQLADIRAGRRDNPIMLPYAAKLSDPQELADVAAYIQTLPIPTGNGRGPGTDLDTGARLYARDCVPCHGAQGQGDAQKFYPVLAGQHYEYMLRQIRDIAALRRHHANPDRVKVVKGYKDAELQAVVDYLSRLSWPARSEAPQASPGPDG